MINGSHSLIRHMVIKSSGKIVYESDNLHRITNAKNLLEYSDDYSRSVAKNSFWYLDTTAGTTNANTGVTIAKQAVRYQNLNLYFKPRTELLFTMITTWPTHEERFPKMPCGRRKLNASCKRTRYISFP